MPSLTFVLSVKSGFPKQNNSAKQTEGNAKLSIFFLSAEIHVSMNELYLFIKAVTAEDFVV